MFSRDLRKVFFSCDVFLRVVNSAHGVHSIVVLVNVDWHRSSAGPRICFLLSLNLLRGASADGCREEKRHTGIEKPHRKEELHLCIATEGGLICKQRHQSKGFFSRDLRKSFFFL